MRILAAGGGSMAAAPFVVRFEAEGLVINDVPVHAYFERQQLLQGTRREVYAEFVAGEPWAAVTAAFTLWAAGVPAEGYGAAATVQMDGSSRYATVFATVDTTPAAAYPLPTGLYIGEFSVTTNSGDVVIARGEVRVLG